MISFALVFGFVRPVVAAPFHIPTESMFPTLSLDSRFFGPVPEDDVVGEALVRFWLPGRAGAP